MYDHKGNDTGWQTNDNWWYDPSNPRAFKYAKLDEDYPELYFPRAEMPEHVIEAYTKTVIRYAESFMRGDNLNTIIEFGCAGGWFTKRFIELGIFVKPIDGSTAAIDACKKQNISAIKLDIRELITTSKYNVALASEILEHIEIPFHGIAIQNLVNSSNLIFFSSEPPDTNQAHYHHCASMPQQYWDNLFDWFDYGCLMIPEDIYNDSAQRLRCVYYNRSFFSPPSSI